MSQQFRASMQARLDKMWTMMMDDRQRRDVVFVCFNGIMGSVSGFMTIVNVFTSKWLLMTATLIFFLACMVNVWLSFHGQQRLAQNVFLGETLILCGFFCISGTPEGFSALWTCFIPSFTLTMLGNRRGSLFSGMGFVMIVVIFWTPWGRSLLRYDYTDSFMLRFPMIYLAFYLMALFLEAIRAATQRRLLEAEQRYQHLYKHDALTGIYNRYGFNELLNEIYASSPAGELGLMILDLDLFKNVNDTYGHDAGDTVLKFAADTLVRLSGSKAAVCRWGGEEFTVLVWNGEDPMALAEKIRQGMEDSAIGISGGRSIRVTVSIGVCALKDRKGVTIAQLVKSADQCLYRAKDGGRNRVCGIQL